MNIRTRMILREWLLPLAVVVAFVVPYWRDTIEDRQEDHRECLVTAQIRRDFRGVLQREHDKWSHLLDLSSDQDNPVLADARDLNDEDLVRGLIDFPLLDPGDC